MLTSEAQEIAKSEMTVWEITEIRHPRTFKGNVSIPRTNFLRREDAISTANEIAAGFNNYIALDASQTEIIITIKPTNTNLEGVLSEINRSKIFDQGTFAYSDLLGNEPETLLRWAKRGGALDNSCLDLDRLHLIYNEPNAIPEEHSFGLPHDDFSYHCPEIQVLMFIEIYLNEMNELFASKQFKNMTFNNPGIS